MEIKGNEVELLCRELETTRRIEVPIDNREYFVRLLLMKDKVEYDENFNKGVDSKMHAEKILKSRVEILGYRITNLAVMGVTALMPELIPGNLVIYANFIAYKAKKAAKRDINFDDIINWFPMGGFNKAALDKFWNDQKYNYQNMVDMNEPTKSLVWNENNTSMD